METGEDARFNAATILFAKGAQHRGLRGAWMPMFHSGSLQNFNELMIAAAQKLTSLLEAPAVSGTPVDIHRRVGDFAMQVSGTSAFGVDIPALNKVADDGKSSSIVKHTQNFYDAAGQIEGIYALLQVCFPGLAPAIRYVVKVLPTPTIRGGLLGRRILQTKVGELLRNHRARKDSKPKPALEAKTKDSSSEVEQKPSGVAPGSLLDILSKSVNKETKQPFSDFDVVVQSMSFVLASYETTSASLAFTLYLLASNPDKEALLCAEIDAFGSKRVPTYADITDGKTFPYAEAVFKEALRLLPPIPFNIREAHQDLQLGKYQVPVGTHLAVSCFSMHRDPEYWRNPDSFIPERFLPNHREAVGNNLEAYMPFGEGQHSCLGQKYVVQEAIIMLVLLYQRYTFKLTPGQKPLPLRMSLGLTPMKGVTVTVHKRD